MSKTATAFLQQNSRVPAELEVNLESYNETLRPKFALQNLEGERKWLLLVDVFPTGTDLDQPFAPHDRGWQASPQARFEKLLRQTGVGIGLLVNGREIRLVYAPEKELSGFITFKLDLEGYRKDIQELNRMFALEGPRRERGLGGRNAKTTKRQGMSVMCLE